MSAPNDDVEAFLAAQQKEYGTYRATRAIFYGGARAFNPGDPVPVSHVQEYGYDQDGSVEQVPAESPAPSAPATPQATSNTPNEG